MSDTENQEQETVLPSKLERLKMRADAMGITYSKTIGETALSKKIVDAQNESEGLTEHKEDSATIHTDGLGDTRTENVSQKRMRLHKEATKLVRVEVVCMNPDKTEWQGEVLTFSNSSIGTIKKFVQFGSPWHVPQVILNILEERKFNQFFNGKDAKGNKVRKAKQVPEFGIKVLDPLSAKEIEAIATRQSAQVTMDEE